MNLRKFCASAVVMTRIGLVCLVLAILTNPIQNVFGIRAFILSHFPQGDAYDAANGLLYGIAIGCLLRAVWLRRHRPEGRQVACGMQSSEGRNSAG